MLKNNLVITVINRYAYCIDREERKLSDTGQHSRRCRKVVDDNHSLLQSNDNTIAGSPHDILALPLTCCKPSWISISLMGAYGSNYFIKKHTSPIRTIFWTHITNKNLFSSFCLNKIN